MKKKLMIGFAMLAGVLLVVMGVCFYRVYGEVRALMELKATVENAADSNGIICVSENGRTVLEAERTKDMLHGVYLPETNQSVDFYYDFQGDYYLNVGDLVKGKIGTRISEVINLDALAAVEEHYLSGAQLTKLLDTLGISMDAEDSTRVLVGFTEMLAAGQNNDQTVKRIKGLNGKKEDQYCFKVGDSVDDYRVYVAIPKEGNCDRLTLFLYTNEGDRYELQYVTDDTVNAELPDNLLVSDTTIDTLTQVAEWGKSLVEYIGERIQGW